MRDSVKTARNRVVLLQITTAECPHRFLQTGENEWFLLCLRAFFPICMLSGHFALRDLIIQAFSMDADLFEYISQRHFVAIFRWRLCIS
jgi:hypothetical protein